VHNPIDYSNPAWSDFYLSALERHKEAMRSGKADAKFLEMEADRLRQFRRNLPQESLKALLYSALLPALAAGVMWFGLELAQIMSEGAVRTFSDGATTTTVVSRRLNLGTLLLLAACFFSVIGPGYFALGAVADAAHFGEFPLHKTFIKHPLVSLMLLGAGYAVTGGVVVLLLACGLVPFVESGGAGL
jgi:hypothetical protein